MKKLVNIKVDLSQVDLHSENGYSAEYEENKFDPTFFFGGGGGGGGGITCCHFFLGGRRGG